MSEAVVATDRRAVERVPTALRGKAFPRALDCTIADYTRLGARLRFKGEAPEGRRFVVVVWSSGLAFEADVKWRRDGEVGVRFASSRDLRRPAPPHLAEAQAAWRKRRPRIMRRKLIGGPVILQKKRRVPRAAPPPGA